MRTAPPAKRPRMSPGRMSASSGRRPVRPASVLPPSTAGVRRSARTDCLPDLGHGGVVQLVEAVLGPRVIGGLTKHVVLRLSRNLSGTSGNDIPTAQRETHTKPPKAECSGC